MSGLKRPGLVFAASIGLQHNAFFETLLRFARTGQGDIRQLKGSLAGKIRLRSGDYRLIISQSGDTLRIHSVRHRREAYR